MKKTIVLALAALLVITPCLSALADTYVYPAVNGIAIQTDGERYGYVTSEGVPLTALEYESVQPYRKGRAIVQKDGKKGVLDENGQLLIPCLYQEIYSSEESQYLCCLDEKWGAMDRDGCMICDCIYDSIRGFVNGYAIVSLQDLYGLMDLTGALVLECKWDYLYYPSDGWCLCAFDEEEYYYTFVDLLGNPMQDALFLYASPFKDGCATVTDTNGTKCFLDVNGEKLPIDGWVGTKDAFQEGLLGVFDGNGWGFVDKNNRLVIDCVWDGVDSFSEGFAAVEKDGLYGFIDCAGNVAVEPAWEYAYDYYHGYAVIEENGKEGLIDASGKIVVPPEWESVGYPFEGIVELTNEAYKIGFFSIKKQEMITEFLFDSVLMGFEEGIAEVDVFDYPDAPFWINDQGMIVCP